MIKQTEILLPEYPRGFHLITRQIVTALGALPETGMLNLFIHHTSAGISINENADPSVMEDLETTFNHIVPERLPFLTHTLEGFDDIS